MQKKGQVTLYIIIALMFFIIIVIILNIKTGLLKSFYQQIKKETIIIPKQLTEVTDYVNDCLERTSRESLYFLGRGGGYYNVPFETSIVLFTEEIPYYYINKTKLIPSLETIEEELSNSILDSMGKCLNFTDFRNSGFSIVEKNYLISTKINEKSVDVIMDYPVEIKKGDIITELKTFELSIYSNMKSLHKSSEELIDSYSSKPGFMCLTCLDKISAEYGVSIDTYPVLDVSIFENNIFIFLVDDFEYPLDNNRNLTLRFVVEQ